jgi:GIY-YIG catalytic domain
MAKISTMTTKGLSGAEYAFGVYPMDQSFKAVGGVYVITRRYQKSGGGYAHDFIYVGETGDFSTRFDDHHKADCFTRHNATCICTLVNDDEDERLSIEDDLIKRHSPPCNG